MLYKRDTKELASRLRLHAVKMTNRGNSSHIGSILSVVDIISVLYGSILRVAPDQPKHPARDRLILSKGHAGAAVYAALAELGFFSKERLSDHYQNGSVFSGHVSHKGIDGVEFSTGSLGHGLSVAAGMALHAQLQKKSHFIHVILSDGECDEGSNWEAIMFAAHHNLGRLIVTVDYNKLQSLTTISNTLELEPFEEKWASFGWHVKRVDGHDHAALESAYLEAHTIDNKPSVIIADTIKGKGVSFMENSVLWHYRSPQGNEFERALDELGYPTNA